MNNIKSFHPPLRTLMGPGPSDVNPRVAAAMGAATIGHLDPAFVTLMDEIKQLLQYAFKTKNRATIPISAPGSAGMEACFVNLLEPGDKAIVCQNGVFGGRMKENVERCGAAAIMVQDAWGEPVDPNKVEEALKANPDAKLLAFVHAETSTGACSDVRLLSSLAHKYGCLSLVDSVTGLGGVELDVDGWEVDAIYSGSQKCLSCPPGLAPLSFGPRAVEVIKRRKTKVQSWFLDMQLMMAYWEGDGGRSYHHTAPINNMYGLHEGLVILQEEGLENAWARHALHASALAAGVEAMGLSYVVRKDARLPQLNSITVPAGIREAEVRARLLNDFNLEIGAGLGTLAGKVWRIGLMGHGANKTNVLRCLSALDAVLTDMGAAINSERAVSAALAVYKQHP
ncbi:MAG TPA: alanine--glyoxylate aminotransferase family protein [Candidatus Acidoferrum sp.]|nr:alanine--glyoxylate aminotransferase family protein [Candidatus Acidoferrum sp.]